MNDHLLTRIARHLVMKSSFMPDPGLYHGKMGVTIFFAHYARYTGDLLYDEFAGELLDEILDEIHAGTPLDFESGLCGIGWGIEYLLQNGFIEGDPDEILSEIDQKVMERDLRRTVDKSVRTGLAGIGYYIEKRIDPEKHSRKTLPFDKEYLSGWEIIKKEIPIPCEKHMLNTILGKFPTEENITKWELGLEGGCAGYGLKQLLV